MTDQTDAMTDVNDDAELPDVVVDADRLAGQEVPAVGVPSDEAPSDEGPAVAKRPRKALLEREGEVAADFLETLLDIADLDGDIDLDVDGDRASVAIVDSEEGRVPPASRGARRQGVGSSSGADAPRRAVSDRRAVATHARRGRTPSGASFGVGGVGWQGHRAV